MLQQTETFCYYVVITLELLFPEYHDTTILRNDGKSSPSSTASYRTRTEFQVSGIRRHIRYMQSRKFTDENKLGSGNFTQNTVKILFVYSYRATKWYLTLQQFCK
jgi:hypothetical protein